MDVAERRHQVLLLLCRRRHETVSALASHFGVSARTVLRDVEALSLTYPIYTRQGRYGGGVYLVDGYAPERLTGLYRPMMSLMSRMVSKASAEDEGARAMQEAFAKGGDWVSAEQLSPVLDALTE